SAALPVTVTTIAPAAEACGASRSLSARPLARVRITGPARVVSACRRRPSADRARAGTGGRRGCGRRHAARGRPRAVDGVVVVTVARAAARPHTRAHTHEPDERAQHWTNLSPSTDGAASLHRRQVRTRAPAPWSNFGGAT